LAAYGVGCWLSRHRDLTPINASADRHFNRGWHDKAI
jgi:hypothetical protein